MLWIVADDDSSSEDSHRGSHITGQDHIIKLHDRTSLHWDHWSFKVAKTHKRGHVLPPNKILMDLIYEFYDNMMIHAWLCTIVVSSKQVTGRGPKLNWSKQTPHNPIGSANVLSALGPSNVQCSPRTGQISAATVETFGLADGKCCKDMMPILQIHQPYLNQLLYTVYMYTCIYIYICIFVHYIHLYTL